MDAATAGLIGVVIGSLANTVVTWINKHFEERKASREFRQKTAFDYWQTAFQAAIEQRAQLCPSRPHFSSRSK